MYILDNLFHFYLPPPSPSLSLSRIYSQNMSSKYALLAVVGMFIHNHHLDSQLDTDSRSSLYTVLHTLVFMLKKGKEIFDWLNTSSLHFGSAEDAGVNKTTAFLDSSRGVCY